MEMVLWLMSVEDVLQPFGEPKSQVFAQTSVLSRPSRPQSALNRSQRGYYTKL